MVISFSSNLSILSEMHARLDASTGGSLALMMHRSWRLQFLYTRLHIQICPATQECPEQWKWEAEYVSRRIVGFDRGPVRSTRVRTELESAAWV